MNADMHEVPATGDRRDNVPQLRFQLWRGRRDRTARWVITIGGLAVFVAMVAILLYLTVVAMPLFGGASLSATDISAATGWSATDTRMLTVNESREAGMHLGADGEVAFFDVRSLAPVDTFSLLPEGAAAVTAAAEDIDTTGLFAVAFDDGRAIVARQRWDTRFEGGADTRTVLGSLEFPQGSAPFRLAPGQVRALAVRDHPSALTVAGLSGRHLQLYRLNRTENFLTGEVSLTPSRASASLPFEATALALDGNLRWVYVGDAYGGVHRFELPDPAEPADRADRVDPVALVSLTETGVTRPGDAPITAMRMLLGGTSLLTGDADGVIRQLFPVQGGDGDYVLRTIRAFEPHGAPVARIQPEYRRRGFVTLDAAGELGIHYSTSGRTLARATVAGGGDAALALSPRANGLLVLDDEGQASWMAIDNPHPEVSMATLWGKVWYENYPQPRFTWQSSASTNDFEPKFSLTPLVFGTLKAATYAMLFAVPLALLGAAYTAVFMAPALRARVKPLIEIMAALPTVILGFLAGLWLAPWIEAHLAGIFSLLLLLPAGLFAFAWGWHRMGLRQRIGLPVGWEPLLLIPVMLALGWLAVVLAEPLQSLLFDGDLRAWLSQEQGVSYDQRNALVVGIAMGFAVVPTIFSIAEDALYAVPKTLSDSSLALGATQWQTLVSVILPTASPGIFSGLMIGFGRAVGETMIVLMATGNTPITDWNIFEGMRTLAANIAVELPESAVHSTHFRILFLSALVLFVFTFIVNTAAELVRQRLRTRYSAL